MTRVAIDVNAAVRTIADLATSRDGMNHATGDLVRPHLGLFPPHVLAMLVSEQAMISGGLHAGAGAVQAERRQIAARAAAFQLADGGSVDARLMAVLEEPQSSGLAGNALGILERGGELIDGIGDFTDYAELAMLGLISVYQRGLPLAERLPLGLLHERWGLSVVGKAGGGVLNVVGTIMSLRSNYSSSGASTSFGKGASAVLGTGVPKAFDTLVFKGIPVMGVAEGVTGGFFSGTQDATVVLVETGIRAFTDPSGAQATMEQWSNDALAGKKGWAVQGIAATGDRLGGYLYDGGQALQGAGDKLGGALYDAGSKGAEWVGNIHRPSWLGG